jgi:predicted site-specific integrase-resolvase
MKLTDKAKEAINSNTRLKNRLALEFGCSVFTIKRWIDIGEVRLIAPPSTKIITEETELSIEEILEESETVITGK